MKMRRLIAGIGALVVAAGLSACSSGGGGSSTSSDPFQGKVSGTITVLTNRTDIVDSVFRKKYAPEFEKQYPGTTVKFEAITNYAQDVTTRLNSGNAGDVALIPGPVTKSEYAQFFTPFGSQSSLEKTYKFIPSASYNGQAYGIPTFGNTVGILYNKNVWKQAGLSALPTTPDEFINDLKQIKAKTSAIPYYTNYHDQWPLGQWGGNPSMFGNANASNAINSNKAPFTSTNNFVGAEDSLLFDIVHDKLSEPDPTTTSWESSKGYIATGKVATMYLGSWAIPQMQGAATAAGQPASVIGFMPYPQRVNGKAYATVGPDYFQAVPKSSKNKATAYAWIKWFALKSGYAALSGGIGAGINSPTPPALQSFAKLGVKYVEQNPAPKGKENLQSNIEKAAQINLSDGVYEQKLIDVARGAAPGTKQSYFQSLDQAWGQAVSQYAGG